MSRRIHRKIPSPAPIAVAIEVARSGKKFRLPHNPRVTSVTHEIIKYQEKHRYLQQQLLTQYQWLLSSGIAIPSNLLNSLQQQLSYNFTYTPSNVLTNVSNLGQQQQQQQQVYHPHHLQQQQLPITLYNNYQFGTIDDISTQIYRQTQLINSIHQLTCHPSVPCHFNSINPTVCLHADPLVINNQSTNCVNNVTSISSSNLVTSITSNSNSGHNKRGLPEPKCQCSLKSSPMHQLHQESCSMSKCKQPQQQQQHHQPQQKHQQNSLTTATTTAATTTTSAKSTTNVHSTIASTSVTTSNLTSNIATTVTTSAMKPALSAKFRTVNSSSSSIMPNTLTASDSHHQHHQHYHHSHPHQQHQQHQHQHQQQQSNHNVTAGSNRMNSLLPSTLQKVVKFNLNPTYSKGDTVYGKESTSSSSSSRAGYSSSLHHQNSVASSICKSLASGITNTQIANRNRSGRGSFARTQSWEQVASIETGVDLDPDVLNRNKRNLPLVPSFKHPTSPTMPMAKMKLIKDMITGTDLNFRRKMQVSPIPRYSLEHELKFGPKASIYANDTLSSGTSGSFIHSKLHQGSLDHPFHFASSNCNKQSGPSGQSNQSTRPSTPTYLMHDHSHHLTGHHGHHSLSAHHLHSHQPQVHHLHSSSSHANHLRRPRSSIFSSLPGSPIHGYSRDSLFTFNNWRDDCYLPSQHNMTHGISDRSHCKCCCNCCLSGDVCNDANCQCCNPYPGLPGLPSTNLPTVTTSVPDLRPSFGNTFRSSNNYIPSNVNTTSTNVNSSTNRHGHISGSHMYHHLYSRHSSSSPPPNLLHCDTCTNNQLTNCTHNSILPNSNSITTTSINNTGDRTGIGVGIGSNVKFPSISEITKPLFLEPTYNLIDKYDYNYDNYYKSKRDKLFRPFFRSAPPSRSVTPNGLTVMSSYLTSSSTPVPPLINNSSSSSTGNHNGLTNKTGIGTGTLTINPSSSATIASTSSTSIVPAIANNKEIIDSPKVVFKNQLKYFVEERKNALANQTSNHQPCCSSHAICSTSNTNHSHGLNCSHGTNNCCSLNTTGSNAVGGSESNINALLNMYSNPPDPVKSKFPPAGASTYQSVPQGCIDPSSITCFTPLPFLLHNLTNANNSLIGRRHSFNGPLGVGASANSSSNYLTHHTSYRPSPSPYPSFYSSYEPPPASSLLTSTAAAITAGTQKLISSSNPDIPGSLSHLTSGNLSRLDALNGLTGTTSDYPHGLTSINDTNSSYLLTNRSQQQHQPDHYSSSVPTSKQATRTSSPYPSHSHDVDSSYYDHHRLPLASSSTYNLCTIPGCVNCSHSAIQNNSLPNHHAHHLSSHHHTGHSQPLTSSLHHHYHHSPVYGSSMTHQRLPSHNISSSIDHLYNSSCINCPTGNNTLYGHTSHPHHHNTFHSSTSSSSHPHSHLLHHDTSNLTPYNYTNANSLQQHSTNLKISKYL